jgi:hypothetical protein
MVQKLKIQLIQILMHFDVVDSFFFSFILLSIKRNCLIMMILEHISLYLSYLLTLTETFLGLFSFLR